jgi:hypothetical protein
MLMTGLPLIWGEKGAFDPGSRPAAAYSDLGKGFDFRPVDVLDSPSLGRGRLLFLAQPQRLAPAEVAALDGWIRGGGRALIFTDPALTWPSELPLGDIRRPPPVGLLAPLLGHWGMTLEPRPEGGEAESSWNGKGILLDSPGRLSSARPECIVEQGGWTALCRIGRGTARVVADADLLRDSLWTRPRAQNSAVVGDWLYELGGTAPRRGGNKAGNRAAAAVSLLALFVGGGLLLHRRRSR